jgi:hypothetical protein
MKAVHTSEKSFFNKTSLRPIQKGCHLHTRRRENLKPRLQSTCHLLTRRYVESYHCTENTANDISSVLPVAVKRRNFAESMYCVRQSYLLKLSTPQRETEIELPLPSAIIMKLHAQYLFQHARRNMAIVLRWACRCATLPGLNGRVSCRACGVGLATCGK